MEDEGPSFKVWYWVSHVMSESLIYDMSKLFRCCCTCCSSMQRATRCSRSKKWRRSACCCPRSVGFSPASLCRLMLLIHGSDVSVCVFQVEESVLNIGKFNSMVSLAAFFPFKSAQAALENMNAISEGELFLLMCRLYAAVLSCNDVFIICQSTELMC